MQSVFCRLFEDVAFRRRLLRAANDEARRELIGDAGFGSFIMSDVTEVTRQLLQAGYRPGSGRTSPWLPAPDQTWSDAPPDVLEARRRAIVFGALAGAGATDALNWPGPRLPVKLSFVIVGAIKAGTTALDYFLGQHPDVCTAVQKETHFFCRDIFFQANLPKYEWLDLCFPHYRGQRLIGEATPEYMYFTKAAERMHTYNPDLKLLLLLRNPTDRAYSQYRMAVARHAETRPFALALREDLNAADGTEGVYTAGGFYLSAIKRLLRWFPIRQLHFMRSEDLKHHHRRTMSSVHEFLGIDLEPIPPPRDLLVGPGPPMTAEDRKALSVLYRSEIRALESFLGWDLSSWRR